MNTGQRLVSLSGIGPASAMAHLLAIHAGAGSGLVINDGVLFTLEDGAIEVEVQAMDVDVEIEDAPVLLELQDAAVEVEVDDEKPILEIDQ